jgi:hypothetical protein
VVVVGGVLGPLAAAGTRAARAQRLAASGASDQGIWVIGGLAPRTAHYHPLPRTTTQFTTQFTTHSTHYENELRAGMSHVLLALRLRGRAPAANCRSTTAVLSSSLVRADLACSGATSHLACWCVFCASSCVCPLAVLLVR